MSVLRKMMISVLCVCLMLCSMSCTILAEETNFQIGDYIIIGQYNNEPIVWRYVLDDENGKLLTTHHILCMKRYGSDSAYYWTNSYIQKWLNSSEEVWWEYKGKPFILYDGELGFLSNFTLPQLSLMKTTTQWTMVGTSRLSENGESHLFTVVKEPAQMGGNSGTGGIPAVYYDFDDIPGIYYGAAMKTTDKVFLLDALQAYEMKQNIGSATTSLVGEEENRQYWLRSSEGSVVTADGGLLTCYAGFDRGIRPAFYLDESAIETMTGSGTKEDPYVLNASGDENNSNIPQEITVQLNDEPLTFDQEPIIENDRVLVPFRAIFEALEAEVSWEGETQTVTAQKEDLEIVLQIGSDQMLVNGETVTLDVVPQIVNDRTLVPIRAVSESLNATVDWDNDLRQVIIVTE